jgi:GAF domain-containing protein
VDDRTDVQFSPQVRAALDELALMALDQESVETLLQRVVDLLRPVMPAGAEVSMTVVREGTPATAAATAPLARELDEVQYAAGHGPSLEAAVGGMEIEILDGRTETRWPTYRPVFLDRGARSSLSVPAPTPQLAAGLNVYAPTAAAFTADDRRTATRFADVAAVALTSVDALRESRELAVNLRAALESRAVIEQAKGILMERHRVTPDQAFRMLAEASQHTNRRVHDLAEHLVLTGELHGRPAGGAR